MIACVVSFCVKRSSLSGILHLTERIPDQGEQIKSTNCGNFNSFSTKHKVNS